jgi:hypothetical protein
MTRRSIVPAALALGLLLMLVVPALAGGWADVKVDAAATTQPPREGQPLTVGFTVLQHGVTPAGWVSPTVRVTSLGGGTDQTVVAEPSGSDGHFVAAFTHDASGYWAWTVSFPELMSDPIPQTLAVADAAGVVPAFDPAMAVTAIERARTTISGDIFDSLDPELRAIDSQLSLQRSINDRLTERIETLTAERDALTASTDGTLTPTLVAAVILLAVLAGAAAGFAMAWLGGRSAPREVAVDPALSPSPRGSTPA